MTRRHVGTFLCIVIVGLLAVELSLRIFLGAGNPLLFDRDDRYGYFPKPNQRVSRIGKRIETNQFGMRSSNIEWPRPKNSRKLRILFLGDSVTHGAARIGQDQTYPSYVGKLFDQKFGDGSVEVLNASAGGWALENELAFLRQRGMFDAQVVILQFGSDDFVQPMVGSEVVGKSPFMPEKKSICGTCEFAQRYVWPTLFGYDFSYVTPSPLSESQWIARNMGAVKSLISFVRNNGATPFVVLTGDREEVGRENYADTRKQVRKYLEREKVFYIDFLDALRQQPNSQEFFDDSYHPSAKGNELIAKELFDLLMVHGVVPGK